MAFNWNKARYLLLALAPFAISCANDPENFCAAQVDQICTVLQDCCNGSTEFDQQACELQVSASCEDKTQVEGVHAGDYVFDEGSASVCYGTIASCGDAENQENTPERIRACGNMVTGHRPSGAACTESAQCEKAGEFPVCHGGSVCAKGILSDSECSFSFETLELKICMGETYCDIKEKTYDPDQSPTKQALEFSGTCRSYVAKGKKCIVDGQPLPCKEGLYCDFDTMDPAASTCAERKGKGDECNGDNCKEGLICDFDGTTSTCVEVDVQGFFCFTPPKCGNGTCEAPYEDVSNCAQDCAICGDGYCDSGEEATCPTDCGGTCGNGTCETGEQETCPGDCGGASCGDGTCDFNGTEPATCPADCCGDGFCDPGETSDICAVDCG